MSSMNVERIVRFHKYQGCVPNFEVNLETYRGHLIDICENLTAPLQPYDLATLQLHSEDVDAEEVYEDFLQWFSEAKWSPPQHESRQAQYAMALAFSATKNYIAHGRFLGVELDDDAPVVSAVYGSALQRHLKRIGADMPRWPQFLLADALAKTITRNLLMFEKSRPHWLLIDILNDNPDAARRAITPLLKQLETTPLPKKLIVRVEPPPPGSKSEVNFSFHWIMSDEVPHAEPV